MKKVIMIGLVVALGLLLAGAVYAVQGDFGTGPCGNMPSNVDVETMKKFHKETFSLRDEIMTKKIELRAEYSKPTQDPNRIAAIQKEIIDLKSKIHEIANKHGIKMPMGQGMMGRGMMGKGHGMGQGMMMGGGTMGSPCPMSQQ